ncbi:MAG: hypothetical protein PHQ27_10825 [Victivallales bacterium]|nr:hypothetical protein [Victivallales bacterium]
MVRGWLRAIWQRLYGRYLPCYTISREPLILVAYWSDFFAHRNEFRRSLPGRDRGHFLFQLGWHRETQERVDELAAELRSSEALFPGWTFTFLVNSAREEELLRAAGMTAVLCHQNAFLDERKYRVIPGVGKRFDAIYIARITPFKRHELASGVGSLRLIGDYYEREGDHVRRIMALLPWASYRRRCFSRLIYREINAARVGLCLSAEEGAMFVSAEYLLCGDPVVSTRNLGGRGTLFPEEFVVWVTDTPAAVAAGVAELIARRCEPAAVRAAVLAKMMPFREVFVALIQDIYDRDGVERDFRREWPEVFTHKLGLRRRLPWRLQRRRGLRWRP